MLPPAWIPATEPVAPFRDTRLDPALRIPRWLGLCGGAVLALAAAVGIARRAPAPVRVLRGILASSAAAYALTFVLDMAEHFRLEKALTGHRLRWKAVPLSESTLHATLLANLVAAIATARHPRRSGAVRGRDRMMLLAPAVFLAVGWLDELVYHRRRAPMREQIIHAVEHIAEGMMWTTLYALRMLARRGWAR